MENVEVIRLHMGLGEKADSLVALSKFRNGELEKRRGRVKFPWDIYPAPTITKLYLFNKTYIKHWLFLCGKEWV